MENMTIILGVGMFTAIVIGLVAIILVARSKLVSSGDVSININANPDQSIKVSAGGKLMSTLADAGIYLPSACGGGGDVQRVELAAELSGDFVVEEVLLAQGNEVINRQREGGHRKDAEWIHRPTALLHLGE